MNIFPVLSHLFFSASKRLNGWSKAGNIKQKPYSAMSQSQKHISKLGDQTQVQQQMLKDSQCLLLPTYSALVPDTSPQPEMGWSWMFWRRKPWGRLPTLPLKLKQCTEYYLQFSDSEKSKSFTQDKLYYCNRFCSN